MRHVIVEKPNGELAIGFNEDIDPIVIEIQEDVEFERVEYIIYNSSSRFMQCNANIILFIIALTNTRYMDIANLLFSFSTTHWVHRTSQNSVIAITMHIGYLLGCAIPWAVFLLSWFDAMFSLVYFFGLIVLLITADRFEHFRELPH
jgi:hypothetical protein